MPRIDETRSFLPLGIAVLTVSDTRQAGDDRSGDVLASRLSAAGHRLAARAIVPDDVARIRGAVQAWIDDPVVDAVITTGGTGFTGRDVTPEALEPLFTKRMDGFSAVFHALSFAKIGTLGDRPRENFASALVRTNVRARNPRSTHCTIARVSSIRCLVSSA